MTRTASTYLLPFERDGLLNDSQFPNEYPYRLVQVTRDDVQRHLRATFQTSKTLRHRAGYPTIRFTYSWVHGATQASIFCAFWPSGVRRSCLVIAADP